MRRTLVATFALLTAGAAQAECPPETAAIAGTIAEAWAARATIAPPSVADDAAALCVQDALADVMSGVAGAPVGWKVGLTSRAAQESLGVDHPVAGRLFESMLLADGSVVPRAFGGRPIVEADMLVRVRDAAVMEATSPMEALASLDAVIPFIELADLMVTPGEPMNADVITAINVGARAGVAGAPARSSRPRTGSRRSAR
jgi:2-keto-4-pentenoate hydratase